MDFWKFQNQAAMNPWYSFFLGVSFMPSFFTVIFARWAHISTLKSGFKAGFILGLLYTLSWQFFVTSDGGFDLVNFVKEVLIGTLITSIMASAIAYVSGKIE